MRVSLEFEVVASDKDPIAEALSWPVYVAVDDAAARFLIGDVAATDWLQAPGPLAKGELAAWTRDVIDAGVAGGGYAGFGLLYSAGGADDEATLAAYQDLVVTLHAIVLGHVAQTTGLGALLGGFGARFDGKVRGSDLDRLRDGVDPEGLRKELDEELVSGLAAFREVGASLQAFVPGVTAPAPVEPGGKQVGALATPIRIGRPPLDGRGTPPTGSAPGWGRGSIDVVRPAEPPIRIVRPRKGLAAGTVVAVTAQLFRVADIAAKGIVEIDRELPTRGVPAQLRLKGRVTGEGQR